MPFLSDLLDVKTYIVLFDDYLYDDDIEEALDEEYEEDAPEEPDEDEE